MRPATRIPSFAPLLIATLALAAPPTNAVLATHAAPRWTAALSAAPAPRLDDYDFDDRLSVNQMNLVLTNVGSFGFDLAAGSPGLEYPASSSKTALFAGGLWIGGQTGGQTRVTVAEYSMEYTPGVLLPGAPDQGFEPQFKNFMVSTWRGSPSDSIGWGEYMANAVPYGAPYRDWVLPDDNTPDPSDSILVSGPDVTGARMNWCVYHDAAAAQRLNGAGSVDPLGIEVQQSTSEFSIVGSLDHVVLLHYRIINKGGDDFTDFVASVWSDPDVGGFTDDLVGYSHGQDVGYAYNATNADVQYGSSPPAVGFRLLSMRRNGTLVADHWSAFAKYINGTDPLTPQESYNGMRGLNGDGSPVINPITSLPTMYAVDGDPVTATGWLDTSPADRRMFCSGPPLTFNSGDTLTLDVALVGGIGNDRLSSIQEMRCHADSVKALYDNGTLAELSRLGGFGPPSLAVCEAPPPGAPNCPRSLDYWRDQCSGASLQYATADLTRLAHAVDSLSRVFDWSDAFDLPEFCAALNAGGNARDSAKAEYAAFLANYLAAQLDIHPVGGLPIVFDPGFSINGPPFGLTSLYALTLPEGTERTLSNAGYVDLVPPGGIPLEAIFSGPMLPDGVRFTFSQLDPFSQPDSFPNVEIRFSSTVTQKAYRFIRPEALSTGAPPGGGVTYLYAGHHDVPFTVWNSETGQQLEVGFLERVVTDDFGTILDPAFQPATFDSTWGPDDSPRGGRETMWILSTAYQPTPRPEYQVDDIGLLGQWPSLYSLFLKRVDATAVIDDGDEFVIETALLPGPSAEDFLYEFDDFPLSDPTIANYYREATTSLGSINRGDVFPELCDEPTPVLVSLLDVVALADRVELRWFLGGTPAISARLERREDGENWRDLFAVTLGGDGYALAIDRSVEAAASYAYRLAISSAEGLVYSAEVRVQTPSKDALALLGPRPHPARTDPLTVWFSLPVKAPATIELLDLAGRLIERREVGGFGAGLHSVELGNEKLAPGIYVLRLRQSNASVARKAVVMR